MVRFHESAERNHEQATATSVRESAFRALHEVAVAISGVLDPTSLARLVVDHARDLLDADSASLLWWDPEAQLLRLMVNNDPAADAYDAARRPGQGIGGVAFEQVAPVVVQDYQQWEHASPYAVARGVRSVAAVSLRIDDRALGALTVRSYTPRGFEPAQLQLLVLFSALVGPALEAARLHAESEQRRAEAEALAELVRQGAAERATERVIGLVCEYVCRLVGADYAAVALREADESWTWHSAWGNQSDFWRVQGPLPDRSLPAVALATGRTVVAEHLGENPEFPLAQLALHWAEGGRTALAALLPAREEAIGTLVLGWRSDVSPTPAQVRLAETLASYAATVIDNARAHAREQQLWLQATTLAAQLAALIEQLPSGVLVVDAQGHATIINEAGRRMLGGPPSLSHPVTEQGERYQLQEVSTGRRLEAHELPLARALAGQIVAQCECTLRRLGQAEDAWLEASAVPLRDPEGQITGAVAVFSDVTRERKLVRDLAASEAQLRDRYQAIACGVLVRDASGRILDANSAAEAVLGYSVDQMRGRTPDSLWPLAREDGSDLPHEQRPGLAALRSGRPVRQFILRVTRPDGERRWLLDDAVPVLGEDGKAVQVVSSFIDITALKRAEERAHAAAERLERLIEATSDAIFTTDLQRRIRSWNRGAERMYGWSRRELLGQVNPTVPSELLPAALGLRQQVLDTGQTVSYEGERLTRDGRRIPVLGALSPLRDDSGTIVGLLGITKDLSAHKQLAEHARLLALLSERERIAADLHDGAIQSLYAIGLRLGAAARRLSGDPAEAREALRQMEAQIEDLIEDIRTFIFDLRPRELDTCSLRTGLRTLAEELRVNASLQVELELDEDAERQLGLRAATHVLYIAREATSNVTRHAGASAVGLRLALAEGQLQLTVRDNGGGFAPEQPGRHVGEGLRNMAARAEALGGRLSILSRPGQGTEIQVEVPVAVKGEG